MLLFTCDDHDYVHPTGVASIVIAPSEEVARELLDAELIRCKLRPFAEAPYTLKRIDLRVAQAIILHDGDY